MKIIIERYLADHIQILLVLFCLLSSLCRALYVVRYSFPTTFSKYSTFSIIQVRLVISLRNAAILLLFNTSKNFVSSKRY
jgi:hypothetical protein